MAKKKEEQKQENKGLFTIYGARTSKKGDRVNISLVRGNDDNKEWACISIKLGKSSAKVKAKIDNDFSLIKIPMLQDDSEDKDTDALDF